MWVPDSEEVEQVPASGPERQVEWCIPLELKPVTIPQQKGRERVLAGFERDLQGRLRPCSLRDGLRRQLKRLPIGDPALDVVEAAFAAQLVEGPDFLKGMSERTMAYFGHCRQYAFLGVCRESDSVRAGYA